MEKFKKFIPLILGVILIGAGVFFYFKNADLTKKCTEKTIATVVDMDEEIDTSSANTEMRYMYYPIVQYKVSERVIENRLDTGANVPEYRINDKVEIMYNPNNVEEFIVAGANLNIVWIILVGLGVTFVLAGIVVVVKDKKRPAEQR